MNTERGRSVTALCRPTIRYGYALFPLSDEKRGFVPSSTRWNQPECVRFRRFELREVEAIARAEHAALLPEIEAAHQMNRSTLRR